MSPILFHAFKHHLKVQVEWLMKNQGKWNTQIFIALKTIGNSQLDLYIGNLPETEIMSELFIRLQNQNLIEKEKYKAWIEQNNSYREIELSDGSTWTLRFLDKDNYIHVHPSRYSIDTIRIKANTLKTVLCALLFENKYFDIKSINIYRTEHLSLSPLDENKDHGEIRNVYNLFNLKNQ